MSKLRVKDGDSTVNQRIKGEFVSREVYANVGRMVEYILSNQDGNAPFSFDDAANMYVYPEYKGEYADFDGGNEEQRDKEVDRLRELQDEYDKDEPTEEEERIYDTIRDEIAELEALESEPQEVLEWWIVSNWMCEKLRDLGEVVIEDENLWGRCGSGQAIKMDYVITQICDGMEILDGQANSWAKK